VSDDSLGPPPEGWESFHEANVDALLRAAAGVLGSSSEQGDDAEDVVSQVLTRLIATGVPQTGSARAYVLTSVRNEARDRVRRRKHHADGIGTLDVLQRTDDMELTVGDDMLLADVLDALDQLPERERTAIQGKFLDERPWREVAAEVGVTTSQGFMKIVNKGLGRIRKTPRFAGLAAAAAPISPSTPTERPLSP